MKEAIEDSGLEEVEVSNFKTGIVMGSGGPSIENVILAKITFSIEGPPEPMTIPVLKLLTSTSSNPESSIASFMAT